MDAAYHPAQTQPTVVVVPQSQPKPPDNLILSVFSCLLFNMFCLGTAALCCACKSRDAANANDMETAKSKGQLAFRLSIAGIVCTVIVAIVTVALYFIFVYVVYASSKNAMADLEKTFGNILDELHKNQDG